MPIRRFEQSNFIRPTVHVFDIFWTTATAFKKVKKLAHKYKKMKAVLKVVVNIITVVL